MGKYQYDSRFKGLVWNPDSADEWLEIIVGIGFDYDGCNTVESLKGLVDTLVEMSQKARECLRSEKIFYDEEEEEKSREKAIAERKRCEDG